jgi:hypothetical protein
MILLAALLGVWLGVWCDRLWQYESRQDEYRQAQGHHREMLRRMGEL